jgi:hypothetical protein
MADISIDFELLKKYKISINEYLILYDVANDHSISGVFSYSVAELVALEKKALIKLTEEGIFLRGKSSEIFSSKEDYFAQWIEAYPTAVKKNAGGVRSLSPASADTILGARLRKKWDLIFKKDIEKQLFAIKVLQAEVSDKKKSGDLEYMVEAARWLNEGFHEKFEHLVSESKEVDNNYSSEDWL